MGMQYPPPPEYLQKHQNSWIALIILGHVLKFALKAFFIVLGILAVVLGILGDNKRAAKQAESEYELGNAMADRYRDDC
jgi:hypothetical protein